MLPGGKREPGEDALSALARELYEELELQLQAGALRPLGQFQAPAANEADTWVQADIFRAALPHAVQPAAELEELRWLDTTLPLPDDLAPLLREQVLPALLGPSPATSRTAPGRFLIHDNAGDIASD